MMQAPDAPVAQPVKGFLPSSAHALKQRGVECAPDSIELRVHTDAASCIRSHDRQKKGHP